jgi:hypothetical protein
LIASLCPEVDEAGAMSQKKVNIRLQFTEAASRCRGAKGDVPERNSYGVYLAFAGLDRVGEAVRGSLEIVLRHP